MTIAPKSTVNERWDAFAMGLSTPWMGLKYMVRYPALWRYAIVPVFLNIVITALVLVVLVSASVGLGWWLHAKFPDTWWGWIGEVATVIALAVAAAGGAAAVWILLQGILCGYFYSLLAREVELQMGMQVGDLKEVPFSYQVVDAVRDASALLVINLGFLLMHCVPVIGSFIGTCGALYFDCLIFGQDQIDYPLALRGWRRVEKLSFFRRHRTHILGLGASVLLLNFLPIVGAVALTTAVTGAVLSHRKLAADEQDETKPLPTPGMG
jgi:uncharacterized protein involved in cysteine biosynthesis